MGTGYTRNDSANNIADGNVINASDLDGEFDAVQAAFNGTTGHSHDGTTGEGPQIATGGLADNAVTTAKITDANVTTAKIADANVTTAKIADSNVTTAKIADANVTTAKIANDAVTLGTKTSGNYVAAGATSGTGISGSVSSEGGTFTVTSNATNANTAGTIVARDGSGNFSAGTITANLTGTASNAALLDNIDSSQFLRSDAEDTKTAGALNFSDNVAARFGNSNDLQIYHDGSNSYILDTATGSLNIRGTNLALQAYNGETYINCTENGAVDLRHDNNAKLATTSTGVSVTGNITVSGTVDGRDVASDGSKLDGIESGATADQTASEILTLIKTVDGAGSGLDADTLDGVTSGSFLRSDAEDTKTSGALNFSDNVAARFGASNDLQLYHDGSHSYISDVGTGHLILMGGNLFLREPGGGNFIGMTDGGTGGTVTLYHNNAAKLTTKTDGVDITGELQADSLDIDGAADISGQVNFHSNVVLDDNDKIIIGNGSDLQIYHDASASYISETGTGSLNIDGSNLRLRDSSGNTYVEAVDNGTGGTVTLYHNAVAKLNTTSTGININGSINAVDDITLAGSVYHEGDTDSYFGFHAANQWRVVTGNTEMLEVNDSYVLLGANSVGSVHTANVNTNATPDLYTYNTFVWTLIANTALNNPSTEVAGMSGVFIFIQDGTGSRTLSLGTDWETPGGAGITLSTAPNAVDIVPYYVQSSGNILLGTPQLAFS